MAKIIKTTGEYLVPPEMGRDDKPVIHLGDINEEHYYSVPEGTTVPEQEYVEVDNVDEVKKDLASYKAINRKLQEAIRAEFTLEDELYANRTQDETILNRIAEIVAEYKVQKEALGL